MQRSRLQAAARVQLRCNRHRHLCRRLCSRSLTICMISLEAHAPSRPSQTRGAARVAQHRVRSCLPTNRGRSTALRRVAPAPTHSPLSAASGCLPPFHTSATTWHPHCGALWTQHHDPACALVMMLGCVRPITLDPSYRKAESHGPDYSLPMIVVPALVAARCEGLRCVNLPSTWRCHQLSRLRSGSEPHARPAYVPLAVARMLRSGGEPTPRPHHPSWSSTAIDDVSLTPETLVRQLRLPCI